VSSAALVLASTSRYRASLLERLEVPFEVLAPDYDEEACRGLFGSLPPDGFALHLARGKAASLRAARPDAWILAADQIGVLERGGTPRLLRKPGSVEAALAQLQLMSGHSHDLITAVVLAPPYGGAPLEAVDRQRLTMRRFGPDEARAYVERHRPLDCAGGIRIEDAGIKLCESIEGSDYTGIIGLPLLAVARLLRSAGFLPGDVDPAEGTDAQ
jgi:septum formation protein